ncbi:DUF2283 domain-containing protein [Candidatus Daviesbacteria bacterium RIFCSPLOWO2_02_FULL_36_7]|uniref:DUF2283 domain-containing protein n=1 Tax=Candidatus Daviesbacteria bacterium RIFCSPLOWO2_02_FULL_36_7 TaxID=1797792 RepID=A0A1F5MI35_9BACT|nr:MAG: DUF2283 domain-containing protein [Candidatus Daviesbacteria bacterium RIFCSPLOWO2_02_FULL_36_7]
MDKVKIFYDKIGNTLTVWFDKPTKEYMAEEADDEVVLMKDKKGKVIGFEKLNINLGLGKSSKNIPLEVFNPA